jgi:hypothetical protein
VASKVGGGAALIASRALAWLRVILLLAPLGATLPSPVDAAARPVVSHANLPLRFEANEGQTDPVVKFLARGQGYALFLTLTEAVLVLDPPSPRSARRGQAAETRETPSVVTMRLVGAGPSAQVGAIDRLPGTSHYLIGRDPQRWRRDVPAFARVRYDAVYPGISLIYYGNQRQLEYDFIVAPGADPGAIVLELDGADALSVDERGDLVIATARGDVRLGRPVVYQEIAGARRQIEGGYTIDGGRRVRFRVASYDTSRPLVIDPVLAYSTYLGGSADDQGFGVAVDGDGNVYLTGSTLSTDFPTADARQSTKAGGKDVFVTKVDATGSNLVYSTYLGGSGEDIGNAIAVDVDGQAYVAGQTASNDFPTFNAFQTSRRSIDGFLSKLDPSGATLVYSTLLGGSLDDRILGVAVDADGSAVVTGSTASTDFPTFDPVQSFLRAGREAFVTRFTPSGAGLVYSTYLGGSGDDDGNGVVIDADGNAYVVGTTTSTNFPILLPFQATKGGGVSDAFVTKLNHTVPTGLSVVFSTYLGGAATDEGKAIALGPGSRVTVVGSTTSLNFPTAAALQPTIGGTTDAFVTRLTAAGTGLVFSTYLGGLGIDKANGVAVHSDGTTHVVGTTRSTNFPVVDPLPGSAALAGGSDLFVTRLASDGSALVYSTFLGGVADDEGSAIALDADGLVYVVGSTRSTGFPLVDPAQPVIGGGLDAVMAQIADGAILQFSASRFVVGENAGSVTLRVTRTGDRSSAVTVNFATRDDTATAGLDYVATSGTLSFAPGETVKTITVRILEDASGEGPETFIVTLSAPTGNGILGGRARVPVDIVDNEPSVNFSPSLFTVVEGGIATVTVVRGGPLTGTVVVGFTTEDGTARGGTAGTPGIDYVSTSGTLTFAPGVSTRTFTVTTVNDALPEPTETIGLRLTSVTGGTPAAFLGVRSTAILEIVDNERTLQFTKPTFTVAENAGSATITVERHGTLADTVTVRFATSNGTATGGSAAGAGVDYLTRSGTLTFGPGVDTASFTIPIVNDAIVEGNETVRITLSNAVVVGGGTVTIVGANPATLVIVDEDGGVIEFTSATYTVNENAGVATIGVKRTGGATRQVTVQFRTRDGVGTAVAGADYTSTSGTLTFAAGQLTRTFTIPIVSDRIDEGNETVALELLSPGGGAILGTQRTATLTIVDDDTAGVIQFSAPVFTVGESAGVATITVTRTGGSATGTGGTDVLVDFGAFGLTATPGADFLITTGTLTFAAGETVKSFPVRLLDDTLPEGNETVDLRLSSPRGGAILGPRSTAILKIIDNEPTVQFSAPRYSVAEGFNAAITVERTGPTGLPGTVTVLFETTGGSAVPTTDYTPVTRTLSFGPGVPAITVGVPTLTNAIPNGPRTVNLRLRNVTGGAVLGPQSTAVLDLIDNDPGGRVFWSSASYTAREGAGLTWAIIRRTDGVAGGVMVDYDTVNVTARAGVNYDALSGTATFAAGATQVNIPLMVRPQNTIETGPLTFKVVLSNPRPTGFPNGVTLGSPSVATVTIVDDDEGGVVQFGATSVTVAEGAQQCTPTPPANACATVIVTRTGGAASGVTADYSMADRTAVSGTHYVRTSGRVTFSAAQTTATIPVQLINNSADSGPRTFTITLANPRGGATLGANTTITVTIADND